MTFSEWLVDQGYRPSTARKTDQEVRRARRAFETEGEIPMSCPEPSLARFLAWPGSEGDELATALRERGIEPSKPLPERSRRPPKHSFPDEAWSKLAQALEELRYPEADVLYAMVCSGLRIGDVLPLSLATIERGLADGMLDVERKGGRVVPIPISGNPEPWKRIAEGMRRDGCRGNVAGWMVEQHEASALAGDGAYQRVNRFLKKLGSLLGLPGRIHLHRLRRTVAVQALRLTGDTQRVQQLLGHQSHDSTLVYVDELRQHDVGQLQTELARFRKANQ